MLKEGLEKTATLRSPKWEIQIGAEYPGAAEVVGVRMGLDAPFFEVTRQAATRGACYPRPEIELPAPTWEDVIVLSPVLPAGLLVVQVASAPSDLLLAHLLKEGGISHWFGQKWFHRKRA